MEKKGLFIAIDGGEGSYKSGAISIINEFLTKRGIETLLTREPGGTPLAEEIRNILLQVREERVHENAELLLMYASRAQHVEMKIKPALLDGLCVVTDRFSSCTIAYQCFGRGISREKVEAIEKIVLDGFYPDLTIIMDVDPEIGMARASKRGCLDRIEREAMSFFHRAREGYLWQAKEYPHRFEVVDASGSFEDAQIQIETILSNFLDKNK